jgi:hypothetical protein
LDGYSREAMIGAEHSNSARRIDCDIRSRWRWRCHHNRSASCKSEEADDAREENCTWRRKGGFF